MRRAWLATVTATLCGCAAIVAPTAASPARVVGAQSPNATARAFASPTTSSAAKSESFWSAWSPGSWKLWGGEKKAERPLFYQAAKSELPSKSISPWRHPIQYFTAAMSETPIAQSMSKNDASKPATPSDSISLDKPVGAPTAETMTTFAQLAERQGNIEQARGIFREAIAKWPTDVELLRATARLEDRQGQLGVAEALYRRAVELEPQHAGAYNDLGLCLARQGKLEQSVQAIEQAVCLQPEKSLYRNNVATVLVELRQDQMALAHLSAVHAPAASNYNLGQLLVARGRSYEAVPYFRAAVDMDPTMEQARVALAQATGAAVAPAQVAAESIPITPTPVPPSYGPQLAPQQSVQQPTFPATARGPAWNTSTHVAPANAYPVYAPSAAPTYQSATALRYLPPVQTPAAGVVR